MICIIVYMYTILFLLFYYTTSIMNKYSCDPKEREETHKALADVLPKEKGQKKRPWERLSRASSRGRDALHVWDVENMGVL